MSLMPTAKPAARAVIRLALRAMARGGTRRRLLNRWYDCQPLTRQAWLHARYARLFWGDHTPAAGPDWAVRFAGRPVVVPFAGETWEAAWNAALSLLGHDAEVKRLYARLLTGPAPPRVMFDIGTNLGFDSVLFLAHGAQVVSFEPNPHCHDYFRRLLGCNRLAGDLRPVAVGDRPGEAELRFPAGETWLGSLDPRVHQRLAGRPLTAVRVAVTTVDQIVAETGLRPDLLKIDTEGFELAAVRGAAGTLADARPLVVFESRASDGNRGELFAALAAHGYRVRPLATAGTGPVLDAGRFAGHPVHNFVAVPDGRPDPTTDPPG